MAKRKQKSMSKKNVAARKRYKLMIEKKENERLAYNSTKNCKDWE